MPKRVALYARVSTSEQTTAPQLHALGPLGLGSSVLRRPEREAPLASLPFRPPVRSAMAKRPRR